MGGFADTLKSFFGGQSVNRPEFPTDPGLDFDPTQLSPLLQSLLSASQSATGRSARDLTTQSADLIRRRGLAGSGIDIIAQRNILGELLARQAEVNQRGALDVGRFGLQEIEGLRSFALGKFGAETRAAEQKEARVNRFGQNIFGVGAFALGGGFKKQVPATAGRRIPPTGRNFPPTGRAF